MKKNVLKFLNSWLIISLLLVIFIFMLATQVNGWLKKRSVEKEIDQLNKQAQDLEQKNQEISDSLSFLNSTNYKEKIAREQLNLKKDGEIVFDTSVSANTNPSISSSSEIGNTTSNPQKWYNYFFKKGE